MALYTDLDDPTALRLCCIIWAGGIGAGQLCAGDALAGFIAAEQRTENP